MPMSFAPDTEGKAALLPTGDRTPEDWTLPQETPYERRFKKPLRRALYPPYLRIVNPILRRRFGSAASVAVDQWYWGHRGFEYEFLRSRLNRLCGIRDKSVLIAGCGTGRDIPSWLPFGPSDVVGVDYFSYQRAWDAFVQRCGYRTRLRFVQGDLCDLANIADGQFDIAGSDAVFEHVRDLPAMARESYRILKPGGILYASFGPLWYCWGGDHISGYDCVAAGYNHLVLAEPAYERYLEKAGRYAHSEHDGRTWIQHGLFSYLRPAEYISILRESGFEGLFTGVVLEPRAMRCLRENPELKAELCGKHSLFDLVVTGMSLICRRPSTRG
jgi:SAM-dependent methyltransferase